jgi:SAM-dependent methyltransferase
MRNPLRQIVPRLKRVFVTPSSGATAVGLKPSRDQFMKYLRGAGLEIGALHNPMPIDRQRAKVCYVDVMSLEEQRRHYPELGDYPLVRPDIVAEADRMPMLGAGSQDFIIANHLLEHVADPIGALVEWYRLLRRDGTLFLALPDKRVTFDKDRPRTTLDHLIADHRDRGAASRLGHYEEYSRLVHKKSGEAAERDLADLLARNYSIHFHVWIADDIAELLRYVNDALGLCWKTLEFLDSAGTDEFIYVLQKDGDTDFGD